MTHPNVVRRIWAGAWCAAQGALLVLRMPALLKLALPAVLVHATLYPLYCVGAWRLWSPVFEKVWTFEKPDGALWMALWGAAYAVVWLLVGVVLFLAALWLVNLTAGIVASPFLETLSETTEGMLTRVTPPGPSLLRGVYLSVRSALAMVLLYVPAVLVAALAALVPVVGVVLGPVLHALVTLTFVCAQVMETPAQRHQMGLRARLRLIRTHGAACLGFGVVAWFLLFFPVSLPLLAAGGTLLFLGLKGPTPSAA